MVNLGSKTPKQLKCLRNKGKFAKGGLCRHDFMKVWVFGEGVDSARGVAAIVICRRNSSCNSSCDAIARNGRRTIAFFLLFRVQWFLCNRLREGMFQTCFECGRRGQVLQSHPLPISPLLQTPEKCALRGYVCHTLSQGQGVSF